MKTRVNHNGQCLCCGNESKKPFCNRGCYLKYVERTEYVCKNCGKTYKPKSIERNTYCSRECYFTAKGKMKTERPKEKKDVKVKQCKICGTLFEIKHSAIYCSDECRKEKERQRAFDSNSTKKELRKRKCKECEKSFTPEYGNKRRDFCSDKCLKRSHSRGNHKNRERARRFGVAYEYINAVKVFERDGWHCQICRKSTPKKNRGTCYPNAPELDHREPMSKGGGHLYTNVQCACRSCNGKKSNNGNYGQIPLFEIGRAA